MIITKEIIESTMHPELKTLPQISSYVDMLYGKLQNQSDIVGASVAKGSSTFLQSKTDSKFMVTFWFGQLVHFRIGSLEVSIDAYFKQVACEGIEAFMSKKPVEPYVITFNDVDSRGLLKQTKNGVTFRVEYTNKRTLIQDLPLEILKQIMRHINTLKKHA